MSSFFSTIDYLNGNIDHNSFSANRTIRKIADSGDPVRSVADQQGAGDINSGFTKTEQGKDWKGKKYSSTHAGYIHPSGCSESINLK